MNINFTEEQLMLQQSIKRFFEKEVPVEHVRELQEGNVTEHFDTLWKKLRDAGWLAIAIPESYGGAGGTLLDLGIFYEESGKSLPPTAIYSTLFASFLIEEIGTEQQKQELLSEIITEGNIFSVAYQEQNALNDPQFYKTVAVADNGKGEYRLSGTKAFVSNGQIADYIIVLTRTESDTGEKGLTAFLVSSHTKGVTQTSHKTFGKDPQSIVELNDVVVTNKEMLGEWNEAGEGLLMAIQKATALQTMEMVGGMKKVIQMTVDYVSERKQFGVSIGSFQAVQHHLANLATLRDGAELAAYQAVSVLSTGEDAGREVSIAKAVASQAYKEITIMSHQLWGGMGYATESDLYLWSNRAKATELSFGTRADHLKKLRKYFLTIA